MVSITKHLGRIDESDLPAAIRLLENEAAVILQGAGNMLVAIANASGVTWTAAQMLSDVILRSGAGAVSDTTATAALLRAAILALGLTPDTAMVFPLKVRNTNTGTLTIVAGTGVTLEGTTTIATVSTRDYLLRFTNVTLGSEAVTLSGVGTYLV